MVDGRDLNPGKCVVIDLDGTLIKGNSLVSLTKFLARNLLITGKIRDLLLLSMFVSLRKIKMISHRVMKFNIIRIALDNLNENDIERFAQILYGNINLLVVNLLNDFKDNKYHFLLATAAPEFYLEKFVSKFKDWNINFIGTPFSGDLSLFEENSKDIKARNVDEYLHKNNLSYGSILSDHHDDMSLLQKSPKHNYLINPSQKTLEIIHRNFPDSHFTKIQDGIFLMES